MAQRGGEWKEIAVKELVVGDLISLKGGDVIPADSKLVGDSDPLKIDESSLTGESMTVSKESGDMVRIPATQPSPECLYSCTMSIDCHHIARSP